jgi:hypothetical protein
LETGPLSRSTFFADSQPYAIQFPRHLLVGGNNVVEGVSDFPL